MSNNSISTNNNYQLIFGEIIVNAVILIIPKIIIQGHYFKSSHDHSRAFSNNELYM